MRRRAFDSGPDRWRMFRRLPAGGPRGAAIVLLLAGGGFLWLRDSSLLAVHEVRVTGTTGSSAADIRSALRRAAADMTTLHVRKDELRDAVSRYPIVKDLRVSADLPHAIDIEVVEHAAVGMVTVAMRRVPVAADGTLLREARPYAELPEVAGRPVADGDRITDRRTLEAVTLLAAAPRSLRPLVEVARRDRAGLHARLRSGPRLDFGLATRLRAKWVAASRVLADARAAGAYYINLRVPDRPVAGTFPDPVPGTTETPGDGSVAAGLGSQPGPDA